MLLGSDIYRQLKTDIAAIRPPYNPVGYEVMVFPESLIFSPEKDYKFNTKIPVPLEI